MVFNQIFIQMYFTPEDFVYVFIRLLSQVFIRDAPGISEKDENRSKSTKVTKVSPKLILRERRLRWMKLILRMKLIRWKTLLALTVGISLVPSVLTLYCTV